jgi:hypothetical protein
LVRVLSAFAAKEPCPEEKKADAARLLRRCQLSTRCKSRD